MKELLNDNSNVTTKSKQIQLLKKHFPQCFDKQGKFMPERLQEVVGDEGIELSKESYSLNWLGKSYARLLANENPRTWLAEDKEHNQKPENQNSENLLIKGDNLEVLKHLVNAYSEKVKMIYIDPPYNTGSDGFVYQDDRKFTVDELSRLSGIDKVEAKRILDFTQSKANSHSAWLTFMYPRLYLARELLQEDGVIIISIDENESSQLKLMCNEIFGEENFAGDIVWKNSSKNDQDYISIQHEYFVVYVRSKHENKGEWIERKQGLEQIYKAFEGFKKKFGADRDAIHKAALDWYNQFPPSNPIHDSKHYSWMDERGVYFPADISGPNDGQYIYSIDHPVTGLPVKEPSRGWSCPREKLLELIADNKVHFGKDETTVPCLKTYLKDTEEVSLTSMRFVDGRAASKRLRNLFGKKVFTNPKDEFLLMDFFKAIRMHEKDIMLDFFAGSGSSAHALWELNKAQGSNCSFIAVQIAEDLQEMLKVATGVAKKVTQNAIDHCDSLGVPRTIFEIAKDRLIRVANKIKSDDEGYQADIGFKVFETISIPERYLDDIEELDSQQVMFDGSKLDEAQLYALLTTWKVYDGISLTQQLDSIQLGGYLTWYFDKNLYLMKAGFTTEVLKALIEKLDGDKKFSPSKVVLFGYNFSSKHQREIKEALGNYANKKSIDVDVTVRY